MGEAARRSRHRGEILAGEPRCIYCEGAAETNDHMPPKSMFRGSKRWSGLEFACCQNCNSGTRGAEAVAALLSRIPVDDINFEEVEFRKYLGTAEQLNPGLSAQLGKNRRPVILQRRGLWFLSNELRLESPIADRAMTVFSAKMGMALFREHVGSALPLHGAVFCSWFANAGLHPKLEDQLLRIMPAGATLTQGKMHAADQFAYRYVSDFQTLLGGLISFHGNLTCLAVAAADPSKVTGPISRMGIVRPGELTA